MKTAIAAENSDLIVDHVNALDWTSTIASGTVFVRSDRLLYPCIMCESSGTHVENKWVKCTDPSCVMYSNPIPRAAWQQAGATAASCLNWAKRLWKIQGKKNGKA